MIALPAKNQITGGRIRLLACMIFLAAALASLTPSAAHAGDWMQVSCVNPNGSSAPSDGWTGYAEGSLPAGSVASTTCSPGSPMDASLPSQPIPTNAEEVLQYTPPNGSMLVGGSVNVDLVARQSSYSPEAVLDTPALATSDAFFTCSGGASTCTDSGEVTLPASLGGNLYVGALCVVQGGGGSCNPDPQGSADLVSAQVLSADLLLSNGSAPTASGFGGSLLQSDASGTVDVFFTASDPGGPGVYNVTAEIDATTIYNATPDANSGQCLPVGTDSASGALMFDSQQPCPTSEPVDIPVSTAGLSDGQHQLTVTVTDAAQNTSTVLSRTITIGPAGTTGTGTTLSTPKPLPHHVGAELVIFSRYTGSRTRLIRIKARNLPSDATISVRCRGHHCPRPASRSAGAAHVRRLWKALTREVFTAGDRVIFTFTAPGLLPETSELMIRKGAKPVAKRA